MQRELPWGFGWGFGHRAHGGGSHLQQRGSGTGDGTCVDVFGTRPGHLEDGRGRGLVYDKTTADRVVSIVRRQGGARVRRNPVFPMEALRRMLLSQASKM